MSIFIDTDPALGIPLSDIDDALAIHYGHCAKLPIAGLSTCFGNASGPAVFQVAKELGKRLEIPVYRGADKPGAVENEAVEALLAHTGVVVALAPMTNVAAALLRGAKWESLVVLGGACTRMPNLRPLFTTEMNFAMDPTAAMVTLEATDVLFPMEVCRKIWFDRSALAPLPDWIRSRTKHWMQLAPLLTGRRAIHPWDVLPMVWLTHPELFRSVKAKPVTRFSPIHRGRIELRGTGRCTVVTDVDADAFCAHYKETISRS